jgi:hypothetical protein
MSRTDEELLDMEVWVQLATLSVHLQWPIEGFLQTLQVRIQMEILHTCGISHKKSQKHVAAS